MNKRHALCFILMIGIGGAQAAPPADVRQPIALTAAERAFVLTEMRNYVAGLQKTVAALAQDDLKSLPRIFRPLGVQGMRAAPAGMMGKFPGAFMALGMATHRGFDELADNAPSLGRQGVLRKLGTVMRNCVACHASYRIVERPAPGK